VRQPANRRQQLRRMRNRMLTLLLHSIVCGRYLSQHVFPELDQLLREPARRLQLPRHHVQRYVLPQRRLQPGHLPVIVPGRVVVSDR
jgi:hypothetical protein